MTRIVAIVTIVIALGLGVLVTLSPRPDPLSQRDFPCEEDEALVYAQRFGPDRVGCVNRESL